MAGESEDLVPGLTDPRSLSLERHPIRVREGSATLSAWRLPVASEEGPGTIVLAEISPGRSFYRGEGVFLGWSQVRLEAAYRALLPKPEEKGLELGQLG